MAQIPLTFLSTAPDEPRFALVNKGQFRAAVGGAADVDLLVDQAVATGSAGLGENLLLLSGHLAAIARPSSSRSPQITLWWMVSRPDGSGAWEFDVVTRAAFASRWGGAPADFEAARAGRISTFRPTRSPVAVKWREGPAVLPGRLEAVTGDASGLVAWMRGRLDALRADEARREAARAEAERAAAEREAARERSLREPISDEFSSFLDRVRRLTDAEVEGLRHEVLWAYEGDGLGVGFDRLARARKAVRGDPRVRYQFEQAWAALASAGRKERLDSWVEAYLRDVACLYAIPADLRRSGPNRDALEDLRDPWRRVVLREFSVRDIRWWHVALAVFIAACVAFPALAVGSAVAVVILVLFGVSLSFLLWFFLG